MSLLEAPPDAPVAARRVPRTTGERLHLVLLSVVVVLLLVVRQTRIIPRTGLGFSPAQLLIALCIIGWALQSIARLRAHEGAAPRWTKLLVLAQLAVVLLSYSVAMGQRLSDAQLTAGSGALQRSLLVALLMLFVLDVLRDSQDVEAVLRWLVVAAAIAAVLALAEAFTGRALGAWVPPGLQALPEIEISFSRAGQGRPQGTAGHPLELGAVMSSLTPIALGLYFLARRRGDPSLRWAVATGLIAGAGLISLSRSVVVTLVLAIAVMATAWPWRRTLAVVGIGVVGLVVALLSGLRLLNTFITLFATAGTDSSLASRAVGRTQAADIFAAHPILGGGLGTYSQTSDHVLDNQYLSTLVEQGLLGVVALLALLVAAAFCALRARRSADGVTAELGAALLGSLVVLLGVNAILDTAGFAQISIITPLLIAFAFALRPPVQDVGTTVGEGSSTTQAPPPAST